MTSVLTPIPPASVRSPAEGSAYVGYTYAYPHKSAYRTFAAPMPLRELWSHEECSRLFLYLHLPFCEHRCGFCNLFTQASPEQGLTGSYLRQLQREAEQTRDVLAEAAFAQCAIGGGTPTYLSIAELTELLDLIAGTMGADLKAIPTSCEVSPATIDADKLSLLRERGIDRISIGVQSFDEGEARAMGRPQHSGELERALNLIADQRFRTLNIDLIYGGAGQTPASFVASIERGLDWQPEELFLYPLYVRPLTGLGRRRQSWDDHRLSCYRAGRDRLLEAGYEQISLRMFRRVPDGVPPGTSASALSYCCQIDGMVGLGCGARSYTRSVHYSSEYATSRGGVSAILGDYLRREPERFRAAEYGHRLARDDQQRRFVLQSLLQSSGLDRAAYRLRFAGDVLQHLPQLSLLCDEQLAVRTSEHFRLTAAGLERSDAIGPWLYSSRVRNLMESYELR